MKTLALLAAAFAVVAAPAFAEHHGDHKAEKKTEVTKEEVTTTEVSGTTVDVAAPAKVEKKTEKKTETKKEEHKAH